MKELSAELRKAQEYENKALKEENENKFPVFHLKVPTGWMNDPNGFSVYKGEYHLFFQYNPYSRDWGSMHWGHVKSQDLIRRNIYRRRLLQISNMIKKVVFQEQQ
ncbi:MAG: hypothetical protein ACLTAX_01390 [Waltera sp.]